MPTSPSRNRTVHLSPPGSRPHFSLFNKFVLPCCLTLNPFLTTPCRKVFLGCASKRLESGEAGSLQMKWGAFPSFRTESCCNLQYLALSTAFRMGKTVQMLGLLSMDRRKPNLIIAYGSYLRYARYFEFSEPICHIDSPTVAILQWRNEIEAHTTGFTVSAVVVHAAMLKGALPLDPCMARSIPRKESL
jgi:hypothetical protein